MFVVVTLFKGEHPPPSPLVLDVTGQRADARQRVQHSDIGQQLHPAGRQEGR